MPETNRKNVAGNLKNTVMFSKFPATFFLAENERVRGVTEDL